MGARAFNKEVRRSIRHSLGRFVAIAAIVALGTGFYAGLRSTAPDMDISADRYFDNTALMDIRVVSTMGMTDEDMDALREVEGVESVMPAYETDVLAEVGSEQYAFRVHSLPESALDSTLVNEWTVASDDAEYLNRLCLEQGRWPEAQGECVICADSVMNEPIELGDVIVVTECVGDLENTLKTTSYAVVGTAHSSYYACSSSMGTTSLGSGSIDQFMYVSETDFSNDYPYTEAFVTVAGASQEFAGSEAYQEKVAQVAARIEAIAGDRVEARYNELVGDAQAELDDARAEYDAQKADAEAQLDDAQSQLDQALDAIEQSEQTIENGQAEYDRGTAELALQRQSAQTQFAQVAQQLDDSQKQVDAARAELDHAQAQLFAAWQQAGVAPENAQAAIGAMKQQLAAIDSADPAYSALQQQITALEQLVAEQQAFDAAKPEAENRIAQSQGQIDAGRAQLAEQQVQAEARFAEAQAQLDSAAAELASGRSQLEQGRAEYEEGLRSYEDSKAEAETRFAEAEAELADVQAAIDDIGSPEWMVMDRDKNYGVVSFASDADRVDSIASVFPFIFFLVAALVALTTMTRMVEEERILIGTFKALGYSKARITSKYIAYAAAAGVAGSAVGIVVLSFVLPAVIMEAYSIIYYVPTGPISINVAMAALSAGLGLGVTLLATWAAATATLREQPAALMLPRAPKAGKRILLERVSPVWRRLSFSWKVTCRNLFRYKKRFVMAVIGIAGCTALLLTGLGLQDSINDIIGKQYGELIKYNVIVTASDDITDESRDELASVIEREAGDRHAQVSVLNMVAQSEGVSDQTVSVVVPQDPEAFQNLWVMREREGHARVTVGEDGVVVTEKLANMLGVGVGDTVTVAEQDSMGNATNRVYELPVTGVIENYVANYVFVGPRAYEDAFGEAPVYSSTFAEITGDRAGRDVFGADVRAIDGVKTVAYNDEIIDTYQSMLRSVNMIVVVLVVAAAALAFIVLYNLTNINITERQREIATLKVLGFTAREVDMYIYRETILLTLIGCLAGLVLGVFLEGFVIVTAEVDQVMFGREIHPLSFIGAFALTMVFSIFVMLVMRRKLARIDMVESLKSNE